jgi:hypothetical protein
LISLNFIIAYANSLTRLSEDDDDLLPLLHFSSSLSLGKFSVKSMELEDIEMNPPLGNLEGNGGGRGGGWGWGYRWGYEWRWK